MVSVKLCFQSSPVGGEDGVLCYKITYRRISRQILTKYRIASKEWDPVCGSLVIDTDCKERFSYLHTVQRRLNWDKCRLQKIIEYYCSSGCIFSVDSIVASFNDMSANFTLFSYMEKYISKLKKNGQIRTSETYASTLNSFRSYRQGEDVHFIEFDNGLMLSYEHYLRSKELSMNTVSFYMRRLRAIYNKAVDEGIIECGYPFKGVYTASEKTPKRALPVDSIKKIKELDLSFSAPMQFARDMFLFSFYTRGMSFVDMAFLKKKNLKNGLMSYKRRKTGQQLCVHWELCMQKIVDKYAADSSSPYIFGIVRSGNDERHQYLNSLTLINRNLKEIGRLIGLQSPLSMYVARHSWASIARNEGIALSIISESMGHDSERTTQIYLASMDVSLIDKANQKILGLL